MKVIKIILSLITTCFLFFNLYGQNKATDNCSDNFKGYVSEIQHYPVKAMEETKLDVVFYAGFDYRFMLCSTSKDIKLNFTIVDEMGNIQFDRVVSYGFLHDFKFESVFHGSITLKPVNNNSYQAELIIGFKRI